MMRPGWRMMSWWSPRNCHRTASASAPASSTASAPARGAPRRGNSVYFPDRVVPMLPEALSNDLCSLVPAADRPCLAVHLWIDAAGHKRQHRFERAIMRSAARLTYDALQTAHEGGRGEPFPLAPD